VKFYNNKALAGASAPTAYTIDRSLRLRSSASAYLSRTPASAGNRKTWTYSIWFKYAGVSTQQMLGGAGTSGNEIYIQFLSTGELQLRQLNSSTQTMLLQTSQVFRDPSAWYHIVIEVDTTQATSSDRIKIYINGSQITAFSTASYYSLNYDSHINNNVAHYFGRRPSSGSLYFDGYLTEINFVDGQALDPTSFGEYNSDTGVWQPIKYTGTYGTNGFYLNFSDNSTTTTLGYDTSGNGNNWTANNISVTSGVTYDSMTDVPTLTSEDAANYATLNPLDIEAGSNTFSNGNLSATTGTFTAALASIQISSGKWYWEVTANLAAGTPQIGIAKSPIGTISTNSLGQSANAYLYVSNGNKANNNSFTAYGATYTTNDVIGVALDLDAGTLVFYKNGASQGTAFSSLSGSFRAAFANCPAITHINFGQRPFAYTPPVGFKSLNTYNLPDSTIEDGGEYFNTVLATGNASTQSITGVGFQPDFVWLKVRSAAVNHISYDAVRGADNYLVPNLTNAEGSGGGQGLTSFDTDGFTLGNINPNSSGSYTFVAWNWKANGSGVSNTDGIITSTVSANTTAGFSIVSWTNQGTNTDTVGHGLGVAPKIYISKKASTTGDWFVFYSFVDGSHDYLLLNSSQAAVNHSIALPTSTVFTTGAGNTDRYITYCFAEVEGFSKFGFYTGNGSANGPFSYLGFRPAFVMIKSTGVGTRWIIWDAARDTYNVADKTLAPNLSSAEFVNAPYWYVDLLSNGFKVRGYQSGDTENNYPGSTYIYMAFAENPFKNALAR